MAARSTWKGFIKISLVNIPVRVFPATDAAGGSISFNQLHAECRSRIQQKRWCPSCEREVAYSEVVKGYEFEKGRYVVVEEADLAKVRPESTRVINLVQFVDENELDPMYLERPYYLAPDGPVAAEAFSVVREGMRGKVGIGKFALYGREYLVAIQPRDRGLLMFTLRTASEIRSMDDIEELNTVSTKVKPEEMKLARQVINTFEAPLHYAEYKDEYREELQKVIDAKVAGEEFVAPEVEAPTNVVNLMEALKKSLDAVSVAKKKTAKVERPAAAAKAPARKRARA